MIPQKIQDLMPERKTIAKKHIGDSWCPDCEDTGFNYAITEVEAVLPQMLALAERRLAEEILKLVQEDVDFGAERGYPVSTKAQARLIQMQYE
jgi:hypothetical protein